MPNKTVEEDVLAWLKIVMDRKQSRLARLVASGLIAGKVQQMAMVLRQAEELLPTGTIGPQVELYKKVRETLKPSPFSTSLPLQPKPDGTASKR